MKNVIWQAPKLHLVWVQYIARFRDKPVPDLPIFRHLLEAKLLIVHFTATLRRDGMNVVSILIIPPCIEN